MFEKTQVSMKKISKEIIKEYDKDGKLVRERTIINDGGTSQEEAEKVLKSAEDRLNKADSAFKRMDGVFSEMDKIFKEMFQ